MVRSLFTVLAEIASCTISAANQNFAKMPVTHLPHDLTE